LPSAVSQVSNLPLDRLPCLRYFQVAELTWFHRGDGGLDRSRRRGEAAGFVGGKFWSAAWPGICASATGRIRPTGSSSGGTVKQR
jgi:hypothetical protein